MKSSTYCLDCKCDCHEQDMYMMSDAIWRQINMNDGVLCLECCYKRLGRSFKSSDFSICIINHENEYVRNIIKRDEHSYKLLMEYEKRINTTQHKKFLNEIISVSLEELNKIRNQK